MPTTYTNGASVSIVILAFATPFEAMSLAPMDASLDHVLNSVPVKVRALRARLRRRPPHPIPEFPPVQAAIAI